MLPASATFSRFGFSDNKLRRHCERSEAIHASARGDKHILLKNGLGLSWSCDLTLLPLPAFRGERVGVRGAAQEMVRDGLGETPPHPETSGHRFNQKTIRVS